MIIDDKNRSRRARALELMAPRRSPQSAAEAVYTSLSDVRVPARVRPGAAFTVRLAATRNGHRKSVVRQLSRASGAAPAIVAAKVEAVGGWRHEQRPYAIARAAARSAGASGIDHIRSETVSVASWASSEQLPFEAKAEDVGWLPGPVNGNAGRAMPRFDGPAMGVRSGRLSSRSSARMIMRQAAFTTAFRQAAVQQSQQHAAAWHDKHDELDGVERAWDAADLTGDHIELWFAANVRLAAMNAAIPASKLWEQRHHLYDAELAKALPFDCWRWLNRHLSFGSYGERATDATNRADGADGAVEEPPYARFAKRRLLSNLARAAAAKLWQPDQHIGFDDLIRSTRHLDGKRTRHKAAVHTGAAVDGLNCARSHYFLWWEEQGWEARRESPSQTDAGSAAGSDSQGVAGAAAAARGSGAACSATADAPDTSTGAVSHAVARGRGGGRGRGSRGNGRARGRGRGRAHAVPQAPTAGGAGADGHGGAEADDCDSEHQDSQEEEASGPTSVAARLARASAVLTPHAGHCIWLDRGLSDLKAMQSVYAAGFHVTGMMQANRIGLPRRYIARLKQQLACPRGCRHRSDSVGCKRWSWTCLHKGHWELQIWSDGSDLVIGLSTCASGTRVVQLARTVDSEIRLPMCPEAIGLYNWFGRGPTDGGDQQRKRLSLAVRRRLRQGPKGALFDAELGFVNGTIVANRLRDSDAQVTLWDFCDEFAREVLGAVSMRRKTTAMQQAAQQGAPGARGSSAAPSTRAGDRQHVPISFCDERRKRRRAAGESRLPHAKRGRTCCRSDCDPGEAKRPSWYCLGCHTAKCTGWYHLACYWKCHNAVFIDHA
jgi:hypothetical protein